MSKSLQYWSHRRRGNSDEALSLSDFDDLLRLDNHPFDINTFNFASPIPNTQNDDVVTSAAVAQGVPNATIDSVSEESNGQNSRPSRPLSPPTGHHRSFSLDSDFYSIRLGLIGDVNGVDGENLGRNEEWPVVHHRQNISMDGLTNVSSVVADSSMGSERKKGLTPHELAELALVDPSRYRKILGNRQSAARSKERKNRYFATELALHHLAKNQCQQTQLAPIMLDMPPSSSSQPFNGHPGSDFFYFNQKN
ncbi:transcription factor VIP1-like [Senna tora]|uniref:Transcription factor VIP1-like n=1 Tax=Senna tora TaxID=362788 RepID=A0A834THE7_9FABA|nr:transcription factor VIP1-like [Senna tora]